VKKISSNSCVPVLADEIFDWLRKDLEVKGRY
jgi:hypothetical protein